MIERFLTTEQVANILQVHPFTILRLIKSGRLKGVKLGRVYRIKEADVNEFLEKSTTSKGKKEEKKETKQEEKTVFIEEDKDDRDEQHYYLI